MKKLVSFFTAIIFMLSAMSAQASSSINKALSSSGINRSAVSISVRDLKTKKEVYKLNSKKPVNPASTQKLVTTAAALDTLGYDFLFDTKLYKTTDNDLYLKLAADPYLTTKDLKNLLATAKDKEIIEPKHIYIDDYVLDSAYWGEGWQWDDDLSPLMSKFGSYNLDNNLLKIVIKPTRKNAPAEVYSQDFYPIGFVNFAKTGDRDDIKITHNETISNRLLDVNGTISKYTEVMIPVENIKLYFRLRMDDAVSDSKILYYGKYEQKKLPDKNVYLVDSVQHEISEIAKDVLQNSNNMAAETVFKVAGGKYVNNTGSINSAVDMLKNYCKKNKINFEDIRVVDGSGVSKNNLMTAEFMTDFLETQSKNEDFEKFSELMATPGTGTLENRMLYFGDNLKAKTGTLSDVSAIAGYITTRRGNNYAFAVMINDHKSSPADKKQLEEYLLRAIFTDL